MRKLFAALVVVGSLGAATLGAGADLPTPTLTPGAVLTTDARKVCVPGYAGSVRNVPASSKRAVYRRYGLKGNDRKECAEGYEVDHLISLQLGGSNAVGNLWPQSYCGTWNAHIKDRLENRLHKLVCDGEMPLREAQECIRKNWIDCYKRVFDEKGVLP